jgi:hypothetical protein
MFRQFQISAAEQKQILFFAAFAFVVLLLSFSVLAIESYNDSVEKAEVERRQIAEGKHEASDFMICNFGATYPEVWSRFHSFLWLPAIYFLLRKNKSATFFLSFVLTLFPFINFLFWLQKTQNALFYRELLIKTPGDRILYQSNTFDIVLFSLIWILTIWQAVILFRILLKKIKYEQPLK